MNANTNAMTTALQQAIINSPMTVPPLNKRLWLYIKDNPKCSAAKLTPIFKSSPDVIRLTLRDMAARGMLTVSKEPRMAKGGVKGTMVRLTLLYSTPSHMKEYALMPKDKRAAKKAAPAAVAKPASTWPTVSSSTMTLSPSQDLQQAQAVAKSAPPKDVFDVESLTIAEARRLYEALHKLFSKA